MEIVDCKRCASGGRCGEICRKFAPIRCISKELLELGGVAHTEIDFVEGRPVNFAEVSYDPEKIQPEALAAAVEEIAGGIYTVGEVDVTHYAEAATLP